MTTWWDVPPPAQGYWYDLNATVATVMDRLRLQGTNDPDKARITSLVPVAATLINDELDRVNPLTSVLASTNPPVTAPWSVVSAWSGPTPTIIEALVLLTIELYRGNPTELGQPTTAGVAVPIDVVTSLLSGHKSRWGIA